ncbi:hypothetical protein BV20DRAFT_990806 [Pilatotrama ljubarskyi]|nr:hypothetical protein BV20DRAFT_990806 [Pilatotrama ljubarskyi]
MEPLYQQLPVDFSATDVQDVWQGHPMCYDAYSQVLCEDQDMTYGDASGHTASADGELQYPYDPMLHFEEELSNNYLSAQLPFAPSDPGAPEASSAALPVIEFYTVDVSGMDEDEYTDYAYARWWTKTPSGQAFEAAGSAQAEIYRPPRELQTYPADISATMPATCDPSSLTSTAVVHTSGFSSGASGSQSLPQPDSGACWSADPAYVHPAKEHRDSTIAAGAPESSTSARPPRSITRRGDHATSPVSSHSSVASSSHDRPRPELVNSSRRNTAVTPSTRPTPRANRWKCPYCSYVQRNKRSPDLKRHVQTHTRPTNEPLWVCCGVPLIDASEHGVPANLLLEPPFEYEGMFMVGGCRKVFSRKDALTRHLRKYAGECFGDSLAPYLPGNRMGAR